MTFKLNQINKNLKLLFISYLIVLGIGVTCGLVYVSITTSMTPTGTIEQYLGNDDDWEPKQPKEFIDLISHVHQHIVMFSFIFLSTGLIFYQNSIIKGNMKKFLIIEPFFSIIITFGGFFILKYVTPNFVYAIIISSSLMYICFYIMIFVCLYDLILNNKQSE